ncbi:MAG: CPBP family intramembrane glutamic endopeptidase [Phycisphaeraceae bacterium]
MLREDIIPSLAGAYVLLLLAWQKRRGVFRESIFADAPARTGELTLIDLLFGMILMFGGPMFVAALAQSRWGMPETPAELLRWTVLAELGMLPAVGLVCIRVHQSIEGGLRGFGFRLDRFGTRLATAMRVMLFVVPMTFMMLMAVGALWKLLVADTPAVGHPLLRAIRDEPSQVTRIGLIASAVIVAPIFEEFFFRGLIQTAMRNSGSRPGRWPVIVATSTLFALVHWGSVSPPALPGLFVLGMGLGYVYERTGALWASMLLHLMFNAANIAVVLSGLVSG